MIDLKNGDCLELMKQVPDNSIDAIVTDPPYEYLNHKLDRRFDEREVFQQWNRIVKDDGMILFFGRGESFYRWNYLLNQMGWQFKEEVIWNKRQTTSPMLPIGRIHETVSILTKDGKVNKVRVPYVQQNKYDLKKIKNDISRISSAINSPKELGLINDLLDSGKVDYQQTSISGITLGTPVKIANRGVSTLQGVLEGKVEQDVIEETMPHNHKTRSHPTQKPVPLMERLIKLVSDEDGVVLDPFMGSGSTGVACMNICRNFVGYEIDSEYFDVAQQRIKRARQ